MQPARQSLFHLVCGNELFTITHVLPLCLTPSLPALPPPVVTTSSSGSSTANESFSLTCSVSVVAHLVVDPNITWGYMTGVVQTQGTGSSLELTFNPLTTSYGGRYTCTAIVNVPEISVSVSAHNTTDLVVTCKSLPVYSL